MNEFIYELIMELLLKLNKKQLKIFSDLAQMLKIQHYTVDEEFEDIALINAIQEGEQTVINKEEIEEFENWLKE